VTEHQPTALIADDEPLLVQALEKALALAWPELNIIDKVGNGSRAVSQLLTGVHDIAFLDIQMPGENGIEVVQAVIEEWPDAHDAKPPPLFVFVTAYNEFAIDAFELAAIDYVVKPVSDQRLEKTVERLKKNWQARQAEPSLDALVVHLVPMKDVIMFEASDKYVVVHTASHEALIRDSLRNLLPRLNPAHFRQIHRSTIVNLDFVLAALKSEGSKMTLKLRDSDKTPVVSRLHRHLFKAM